MSIQDAVAVAKRYVVEVGKTYPVKEAYVFGSYAKNKADESSDIDVCVVSPAFGRDYVAEEMILRKISVRIDPRLTPVAFSPTDLNDKYSQLASEVVKYGVRV